MSPERHLVALLAAAAAATALACGGPPSHPVVVTTPPVEPPATTPCPAPARDGCLALGRAAEAADPAQARRLLRTACDDGGLEACERLARLLRTDRGGAPDPNSALSLFQRACTGGLVHACFGVARAYLAGEGDVPRDADRAAVTLLRGACDQGDHRSCHELGDLLWRGRGHGSDRRAAVALWTANCLAGDALGCFETRGAVPAKPMTSAL